MAERQTFPVLPLRGTVLFPRLTLSITAGRPGSVRAIEAALKADGRVFAVAQTDPAAEPTRDGLYAVGVVAHIGPMQRGPGGVQLLIQGVDRARALRYHEAEGYLTADVEAPAEPGPSGRPDPAFEALARETRERVLELGQK